MALQQELLGNFKSSSYSDCSLSFLRKDLSDPTTEVPQWITWVLFINVIMTSSSSISWPSWLPTEAAEASCHDLLKLFICGGKIHLWVTHCVVEVGCLIASAWSTKGLIKPHGGETALGIVENNFWVLSLWSHTCFVLLSYIAHQPSYSEDFNITGLLFWKFPSSIGMSHAIYMWNKPHKQWQFKEFSHWCILETRRR